MSFLRLLLNIFLIFILFFSSTLFAEDEETTGYIFIDFAKNHLEERGEDSKKIIDDRLQNEVIQKTEFWTIEEARSFLKFLLDTIGPDETTKSIRNGFNIIDFEEVSYSDFMEIVNLFIKHIGKDRLVVKLLNPLKSQNHIIPEYEQVEDIEHLILFIKDYVKDENTTAEIIINNDLSFIKAEGLRQFSRYLEEKGFEKSSIVELMKIHLPSLHPYSKIERKIEFLMGYGFSKANILEILKVEYSRLDIFSLNELEALLKYLEDTGLKKPTIIDVVTKNFYELSRETFYTDFSDLKEVIKFLEDYVGEEAVNRIASENFMFFYNIKITELKQLLEGLEKHTEGKIPMEFFYDLSSYNRYGLSSSDNLTTILEEFLNGLTQSEQIEDNICLMALTNLSVSYNLPIKNNLYFISAFFNLRRFINLRKKPE